MAVYTLSHVAIPSSLDEDLTSGELDIDVVDASTWPTADFLVRINLEVIDIQSRTGNTLTVRSGGRGVGDTIGVAHSTSDIIEHVLDKQDLPFRRTVGSVNWEAQGAIDLSNQRLYAPLDPTNDLDVGDRAYNDLRYAGIATIITDHDELAGLGDDDHSIYWNDTRGDAKILTHKNLVSAHHVKYTDGEAVSAVGTPWVALIAAEDHDHDTPIGVHAALPSVHHVRYADSEAAAKIALDDLYVKIAGDVMGGDIDFNHLYDLNNVARLVGRNSAALVVQAGTGQDVSIRNAAGTTQVQLSSTGVLNLSDDDGDTRFKIETAGDLVFYFDDGATPSMRWDESQDRWYYYTDIRLDGTSGLISIEPDGTSPNINIDADITGSPSLALNRSHQQTGGNLILSRWENDGAMALGGNIASTNPQYRINQTGLLDLYSGPEGTAALAMRLDASQNITVYGTVQMNGEILTGPLDPTAGTHVGDRDYNDVRYGISAEVFVKIVGDTMSGDLDIDSSDPTIRLDRATQGGGTSLIYFQTTDVSKGRVGLAATGNDDMYFTAYDGSIYIQAISAGASAANAVIQADDSGGTARTRFQADGDGSTILYDNAGANRFYVDTFGAIVTGRLGGVSDPTAGSHVGDRDYNDARYLELDGTGTMAGNLNMGDYGLTNVRDITGRTNLTLSLLPGTGQELALKDDTGVIRIRVYDNAVGDIVFNDAAGALTFFWDESNGWFRMFSDLDMEDNNILGDGTNVLDGFLTVRNALGALYFYSSPSAAHGDMRWYVSDSGGTDRLRMSFPTDGAWALYDDTATFVARWLSTEEVFRIVRPFQPDVMMLGSGNNPTSSVSSFITATFAAVTDQVGYIVIDMENGVGEDVLGTMEVTGRGYWNAGNAIGKQTMRVSFRYDHSPTPTVTVYDTEYPVSFGYFKDNYKIGEAESWDDGGVEKIRVPVYKIADATTSSLSFDVSLETANADQLHVAFHDSISWVAPVTVSNTETYQTTFFLDSGYVSNPMSVDLQMAGNDINDVGQLLGFAGQHISMQPRTGYESRLEDDAGIARVRVMPSATGDIIFTDTGGTATMWWDQSSTAWKVEDTLDLQNNHLWDVLRVTSTTGNLELYAIADATSADVVLAADDSGGVARFRQRIYGTGDIVWYKVDGTTAALLWDESAGSLDITGFMDVTGQIEAHGGLLADGAYIGDVAGIYSIDAAMRVEAYSSGASSQNIQFWADDSAGDSIKRVDIYGAGDIQMWREDGITSIFSWDESAATLTLVAANGFNISGDMNMLDSKITDINSLEADGTLPIVVDGNTVASFNDSGAGGELTLYGEGTVEGGQITIEGGSSHGTDWIFDRYQDRLRFLYGGSTKFGIRSDKMTFGGDGDYGLGSVSGQGGSYGTVATVGTGLGSYEGYSINGDFVFMSNSSTVVGIYDDTANQWLWRTDGTTTYMKHNNGEYILNAVENSYIQLHHNNLIKLTTVTGGVDIEGAVTFSGADNWGINGGDDFNVTENGAVRFRIRDDYNDGYHEFLGTNGTIIATISTDDFSVKGAVRAGLGTESALTNGYFYGIIPTTGSAANAYWAVASGSTYYALRFSSSERYKKEIKTFKGKIDGTEVSIFNLTPSVYRGSEGTPVYEDIPVEELEEDPDRPGTYKGDTYIHKKDKDGHFLYRHDFNDHLSIGLIAEDVAENFPSAAVYDEAGRPESVDWNNIIAGMLYEMQIMREEIDALKAAA